MPAASPLRSVCAIDLVYPLLQQQHDRKDDLCQQPDEPDSRTMREELHDERDDEPPAEEPLLHPIELRFSPEND